MTSSLTRPTMACWPEVSGASAGRVPRAGVVLPASGLRSTTHELQLDQPAAQQPGQCGTAMSRVEPGARNCPVRREQLASSPRWRVPRPSAAASPRATRPPVLGQPRSALRLLARLRGPHRPLDLHAPVDLAADPLDALEHSRRQHLANDDGRWREVVSRDVARERDLQRLEQRPIAAHARDHGLDLAIGRVGRDHRARRPARAAGRTRRARPRRRQPRPDPPAASTSAPARRAARRHRRPP